MADEPEELEEVVYEDVVFADALGPYNLPEPSVEDLLYDGKVVGKVLIQDGIVLSAQIEDPDYEAIAMEGNGFLIRKK